MIFHPDVLACHAQFGGDLVDMQRRYDQGAKVSSDDYDMSIHTNPDARAWAKFYAETRAKSNDPANFDSEENMIGWFANAMMAMHDHLTGQHVTVLPDGSAFFTASVPSGA